MAERSDADLHKIEVAAANKTQVSIVGLLLRMKINPERHVRVKIYQKYREEMAKSNPGKNFNEPYGGKAWQNLAMLAYIKSRVLNGEVLDGKTLEFRPLAAVKDRMKVMEKGPVAGEVMDEAAKEVTAEPGDEEAEVFANNLTPVQILKLSGFEVVRKGKVVAWVFEGLDTPRGKVNSSRGFILSKAFVKELNRRDEKGELIYDNKDKVKLVVYKHLWEKIYRSGKVGDKYHIRAFKQSQAFLKSEIDKLEKVVVGEKPNVMPEKPKDVKPAEPKQPEVKPAKPEVKPAEPKQPDVKPAEPKSEVKPAEPEVKPVEPKPEVKPAEPERVAEGKETPAWNKEITLTFDDSLKGSEDIIQRLEGQGITDYRFFAEFATALKTDVLKDMGISGNNKYSNKITPGKWLTEYVDRKRGSMSRTDYIRQHMLKDGADGKSTDYKSMGSRIRAKFQQLYPTNWMDKLQETFAYHAAILHPLNTADRRNHIQHWTPEQIKEDILTFEEFMKAWLGVDDFKVRYLRPPVGGGFGFDKAWKSGTGMGNAAKLVNVLKEFRPNAKWQLWNVDSGDTRRQADQVASTAEKAVRNPSRADFHTYEPRGKTIVLMHTKYYSGANGHRLDSLVGQIDKKYKEREARKAAPAPAPVRPERVSRAGEIPSYDETVKGMEWVKEKYRHYFDAADRKFLADTIVKFKSDLVDQNRDQYMVVVDRAKQFAALVFFSAATGEYKVVGNFGAMTSTGKQNPSSKSWATPMGVFNLKPFYEKRVAAGKREWRTQGTGHAGFGPRGSRVFHLGYVDVNSPWRKNASIAMHKTDRGSQRHLGETSKSHGCIRMADGFIDLLDKKKLLDSEFGHHVIVGDSSTNNEPKYPDVDHGKREMKQ